jgi:hypothetical protein
MRTIHAGLSRLVGQDPSQGMRELPERWGLWPGAGALLAFVWLELVPSSRGDVPVVGLALAVYAAYTLLGALMYGEEWFARADPFEVYSTLAARISPLGRRDDGKLVLRNPSTGSTPPRSCPAWRRWSWCSSAPPRLTVFPVRRNGFR